MREILLSTKRWIDKGLGGLYRVYDNLEEALDNGVKEVFYWREIKGNKTAIEMIASKVFPWVLSDDKFVPDYTNDREMRVVPLYRNGSIIKTSGCVIQVLEYHYGNPIKRTSDYFRTCTGTFAFNTKEFTTEKRKYPLHFAKFYRVLGNPYHITPKKREAAFCLLSPMSETHGRMGTTFIKFYPHYKRHRAHVVSIIAREFFNQPWFYKLIKKDWLMSMLVKNLQTELEKKNINDKWIVEKLELAAQLAQNDSDSRALLAVVKEIKDILSADINDKIKNSERGLPPSSVLELPPAPVVDGFSVEQKLLSAVEDVGGLDDDINEAKIIDANIIE